MARVKRGVAAHRRHKRLLQSAEGRMGTKSRLVRPAREAALHALAYAYRDRRTRKRDFRTLWIARINAAARAEGISYSALMHAAKLAGASLDRKILADMAVRDPKVFREYVELIRSGKLKSTTSKS